MKKISIITQHDINTPNGSTVGPNSLCLSL